MSSADRSVSRMRSSLAAGLSSPAPEKLDSVTFDRLLAEQRPVETGQFDLRATRFVSPAGLVNLGLAIEAAGQAAGDVVLRVHEPDLRTYLARSGFLAAFSASCRVEPDPAELAHAYDHRVGRSPMLIELTRVHDSAEMEPLLDRTITSVGRLRGDPNDPLDVAALLSELAGNILEHGGGHGLLAMQVYGDGGESFLELAIGDLGPGIRQSLRRNPAIPHMADDIQAIREAVRPMISGSTAPARGSGLYQLLRVIHEHGGSVQIRTGTAKARWRADRPTGMGFPVPHLDGTQISFTIPAG